MGTVHQYNQMMKDFPLNSLLSSTDLDKVHEPLPLIFSHLNKKLKVSPCPSPRAFPLVEAISRGFNDILRILTPHQLVYTPCPTFERPLAPTMAWGIFRTWDDLNKEFTNVARGVATTKHVSNAQLFSEYVSQLVLPPRGMLIPHISAPLECERFGRRSRRGRRSGLWL